MGTFHELINKPSFNIKYRLTLNARVSYQPHPGEALSSGDGNDTRAPNMTAG